MQCRMHPGNARACARIRTQMPSMALDLSLRRHEFLTFLGPSGSGKTTTLMMVAGLQQPEAGAIVLDGQPVDRLPPYRRNIGMVFQHYALFPHMTVAATSPFRWRCAGCRAPKSSAGSRSARAGRPRRAGERLPAQLSGGQQQRVALARAIVYRAAAAADGRAARRARQEAARADAARDQARASRASASRSLYVTHDQEEALTMSDRIAVFNNGRIEQVGTPAELYERPATRFVASFIGKTNFFPGTVVGVDEATCEVELGGTRRFAVARGGFAVSSGSSSPSARSGFQCWAAMPPRAPLAVRRST